MKNKKDKKAIINQLSNLSNAINKKILQESGEKCWDCNGSGKDKKGKKCFQCKGDGYIMIIDL